MDEARRRHHLKVSLLMIWQRNKRLDLDSKAFINTASESLLQGLEATSVGPEVLLSNLDLCGGATTVNRELMLPLLRQFCK